MAPSAAGAPRKCTLKPRSPTGRPTVLSWSSLRGRKGDEHCDPADPPRRRANKRRGRGTCANDRPPIVGTVGRESGHVRLRVVPNTQGRTLRAQVHQFTGDGTHGSTDAYASYNHLERPHATVTHGQREWARDDDGEGMREVHTNTCEGMWALLRVGLARGHLRKREANGGAG